ncbi:alpha/beta hydrolase [Martelella lutilitoris]|uniref:Alpha/beta hydrolase n=1 Tax=Martelella lutilitoris TaxID=2583532 RepID=A0A5C4JPZ9_9HYPH|nr:alpha/beta hydrolase [Martelella lutilitoris]TNB47214.1 alpha/beta hydrolase [Martelella lutilitoris]
MFFYGSNMSDFVSPVTDRGERSGFLLSGGFRLSFKVEGQGHPILVIGSAAYYARCFPAFLRQRCRFHFIDHCGFAARIDASDDRDFSLDRVVEDIERMRRDLALDRFCILGHSGHGYMALAYAARFPQHVTHVVMVGTAPSQSAAMLEAAEARFEAEADAGRKAVLQRDLAALADDIAVEPDARFRHLLLRLAARSWFDPSYDARPLWKDVPVNDPVFDHLWGEVFRDIDIRALAEKLDVPVMIALGAHDYLIGPPRTWQAYLPAFAKVRLETFAKSGHTPPLEEPEAFAEALLSFMEQ